MNLMADNSRRTTMVLALAMLLFTLAIFLFLKLSPPGESRGDSAFFYDLEEQTLFVAPRRSIPPIAGVRGKPGSGVRAVVVSTSDDPKDKKHRQIAYLEKYSPELKQLFEEIQRARAEGRAANGRVDRGQVPHHTLVKRLDGADWYPLDSPEGERIASDWQSPGPGGRAPTVCSP